MVVGHIVSTVRKEGGGDTNAHLIPSFVFSLGPLLMGWYCPHPRWVVPFQLTSLEMPPQTCL